MISRLLTNKDIATVKHVENHGFITIKQCRDMFYHNAIYGYDIARKHINKLVEYEYFQISKLKIGNYSENIYYMNDIFKDISYHTLLTMNYYCNLIKNGVDIIFFQREYKWINNKYRSDAFCIFNLSNATFFQAVEVMLSRNIDNLIKYEEIFNSQEAHKICKGTFPTIILIDDIQHSKKILLNKDIQLVQLDCKLNKFSSIFV